MAKLTDYPVETAGPNKGRRLVGPCSLDDALELSVPSARGTRVAVSSPETGIVAIRHTDGITEVIYLPTITGHGGSIENTGRWIPRERFKVYGQWRPSCVADDDPK